MTNGEVIESLFPNVGTIFSNVIDLNLWWKAEYKEPKTGYSEPFINKPCISIGVCHEDKIKVLDKIRAEIEKPLHDERYFDTADAKAQYIALNWCIEIIDKYRAESEDKE